MADLTLAVTPGEFLAVLGPSGSGKTTTMRIVGGFVRPDSGRVEISGRDVTALQPFKRDVNTVFQSYALFPHMCVEDNVAYGLKVKRVPKAERTRLVGDALSLVHMEQTRRQRPSELSGGMQQRVALARALVNRPSVLLLDEPLGALDRKLREEMQVELRALQVRLGITFVYVTHDQDEALGMSDRVAVMRDGRLEQIGHPVNVYDDPANLWVASFVGASNQIVGTVQQVGETVRLRTDIAEIDAARRHGVLTPGQRAVAVVRPEHVEVCVPENSPGTNQVGVYVNEVLNVGNQIRAVAYTPGGVQLCACRQRLMPGAHDIRPGEEVSLKWPPEAVHVFPFDEGTSKDGSEGDSVPSRGGGRIS